MSKQTAINWLEEEFIKLESTIGVHGVMYELLERAKEIEECQTIDFARHCLDKALDLDIRTSYINAEKYYYETYK
jgi:hypothetical protein